MEVACSLGQGRKNMKLINSSYNPLFYIYFILMGLIYVAYVWLFNYRMNLSEVWLSKSIITSEDLAVIGQLGNWSERLEILFLLLFVGMMVFGLWKRRSDHNVGRNFLVVNAYLTIGIVVFSLVFARVTPLTFMDLMLPLLNLVNVVILIAIFLIVERLIKSRRMVSRA